MCIQPCFASTDPLKRQVTRWWWLSCVPVCQAGMCTFCSQDRRGNPMTLNLDIAATRDELENTAQVVLPLQLSSLGHPCLSLWLTLCPEEPPWALAPLLIGQTGEAGSEPFASRVNSRGLLVLLDRAPSQGYLDWQLVPSRPTGQDSCCGLFLPVASSVLTPILPFPCHWPRIP